MDKSTCLVVITRDSWFRGHQFEAMHQISPLFVVLLHRCLKKTERKPLVFVVHTEHSFNPKTISIFDNNIAHLYLHTPISPYCW